MLPKVRYIKSNQRGAAAARNTGISLAKGKYIALTDDDCVLPHNWLTIIQEKLDKGAIAVGGPISNGVDRYIAVASHILQFADWSGKKEKLMHNIPTANIAYRRSAITNHRFAENIHAYEDSMFNYALTSNQNQILYCPDLEVVHNSWLEDYGLRKFFTIQRRTALGFAKGGYVVHERLGKLLMKYRILNLLCPNLLYSGAKCLGNGSLLKFLYHLPLMFCGEIYKAYCIMKN